MDVARSWMGSIQNLGQGIYDTWQFVSMPDPDFSATNPWRDWPSDKATHDALREILWISDTLSQGMSPTSLPDDDYQLYSDVLRSLETRGDVTYLVLDETGVAQTIMALSNRGDTHNPIPEEPFELHERIKKLYEHWWEWQGKEDRPEKWEARFDTTVIPPLVSSGEGEENKASPLTLTEEQAAVAEELFASKLSLRKRMLPYLKRHPPRPMGFSPKKRDQVPNQETWDSLYTDDQIRRISGQGRRSADEAQAFADVRWKPIMYRELISEMLHMPRDWVNPDETAEEKAEREEREREEKEKTEEEWERERAISNEKHEKVMERNERKKQFQNELKEERKRDEEGAS